MWPAFEDVWVTSWGSNRRDGVYDSISSTLQVYHAMLMSNEQCNNVTMRFGVPVTENFFCVTQTGRRAPCTRDTGAPAVSDGVLWGLASWGIRKLCGTERFPAMFSYLASKSNLAFITNATNYLMSDKRYFPYYDRFSVTGARTSTKRRT
ncbi:eupolytin [Danaus plexippus plexippus]|uniref:Eupolytin n=1 Tax=Danaus plexippus plexippus TaxID=278856 RepID=A0A212FH39_DANPL|nr:eupolytin [Danaus plexippus plexippus]